MTSAEAINAPAFAELRALYEQTPLAKIDREALKQWHPVPTLWGRVKPLLARQAGATICRADVDQHRLQYWDSGDDTKPVLVLIHGFGSSKENWADLSALMRKHYRILAPDLPGFGNSSFRLDCDYRVESQADRMIAWLEQLGLAKVRVAGSSMGGAIAAVMAAKRPDLVEALCLMNAAGAPSSRLSVLEAGILQGQNFLVANTRAEARRVFGICFHERKRALGLVFALITGGEMAHRSLLNHAIFADLVASLEMVHDCLPRIASPTFVLWGDSDRVLDVSCTEVFLDRIAGARAMVLPGTGHLPMIERPKDTAMALQSFLTAVALQSHVRTDSE